MTGRCVVWALVSALVLVGLSACGGGGDAVEVEVPAAIEFVLQPQETVVSNIFQTTVVFRRANGDIMPVVGETVKLFLDSNPGGAQLLGETEVNSDLGVCYFLDSLTIAEVADGYTLRAESADGLTVVSDPFNIIPVQVGSIVFLQEPLTTPSGEPFIVSVQLRDQVGNLLPRDGVPVTVKIRDNPAGGTLSGILTVDSVLGVSTFPGLSIDQIGDGYTLQATQDIFNAFSGAFNIVPPPVAGVAFTVQPPAATDADAPFDVQVELRDASNNLTPRSGVQVTVSIENNPGGGALSGPTMVASVNGVCDFSGLSISKAGSGYTLKAAYTVFEDTSDAFDILMTPPVWDSAFGTQLTGGAASDDSGESVNYGFSFPFFGVTYTNCYVNSNGSITFGASDSDFSESLTEFSQQEPRISGWWDDLNPGAAGTVNQKALSDRLVITYDQVPEWSNTGAKSWQVTMWDTGRIDIFYGTMTGSTNDGIVGISPGGSLRTQQSFDFSATVFPNWTNVGTGSFPYEQWSSAGPDLAPGGWIVFDPVGPSFDGTDGYAFSTSG